MKLLYGFYLLICTLYLYSQEVDTEIKVSQKTININYTSDMDSIRGEFIITNLTDTVIKVLGTDRDCTCSGVKVSSNEIQPQKTITLIMSVAIKNNSSIDTNSILVLNTKQKFYKLKIKGNLISK
jgi:hypothetical protein